MRAYEIKREDFDAYVKVQIMVWLQPIEGKWNMRDPRAIEATGLSKETYTAIIEHFSELARKWPIA